MGLSSLSKTKPSGGREEELRYPHLDVVVELDVKSGTSAGTVASPNTFDVVAELDDEPDAKSGTTMGLAPLSKTNPGGRKVEFMVLVVGLGGTHTAMALRILYDG